MLRVNIEIVPFGDETQKRTIYTMTIARNSVYDDPCDYIAKVFDGVTPINEFIIKNHPYKAGAWELVRRATEVHCGIG